MDCAQSCAAYIDIYVSTLIAVLTGLRLYSIIRALTYYRRLKRFNDRFGLFHSPLINRWPTSINWTQPSAAAPVVQHNPSGGSGGGGALSELSGRHNHRQIASSGYYSRQSHYNQFNHQPAHMADYAYGHSHHSATGAKSTLWSTNGQAAIHNDTQHSSNQAISSNNMISQTSSTDHNGNDTDNKNQALIESEFDAATLLQHINQSASSNDNRQSDFVPTGANTYRSVKDEKFLSRQQTKLDLIRETSVVPDVLIVDNSREVPHKLVDDDDKPERVRQTGMDVGEGAKRKKLGPDELILRRRFITAVNTLNGRALDHQRYSKRQQVSIDTGFESEPTVNSGEGTINNNKVTIKGSIASGRSHHRNQSNQPNEDALRDLRSSLVLLPSTSSSSMSLSSSGEAKLIRPSVDSTGAAAKDTGAFAILSASQLEKLAQRIVATKRELRRTVVDESHMNSLASSSQRAGLTTKSSKFVARNKSTAGSGKQSSTRHSNKHAANQRRDCDTDSETYSQSGADADADANDAASMAAAGDDRAGGRNSVEVYSCSSGELRQTEEFAVRAPTQATASNKLPNRNNERRGKATGNYNSSLSSRKRERASGQIEHATNIAADHNSGDNTLARLLLGKCKCASTRFDEIRPRDN